MKNHLGSYECKLCLTLHNNEVTIIFIPHCNATGVVHFCCYYHEKLLMELLADTAMYLITCSD